MAWRFFKRRVIEARKLNQWTYANAKSQVKIAITGDAASTSQDIDIGEDVNALDAAGNLHPHTCKNSRPDLSRIAQTKLGNMMQYKAVTKSSMPKGRLSCICNTTENTQINAIN